MRTAMRPDPAWNDTGLPYPAGQSLHGIVAGLARDAPERTALVDGSDRMSYGRLDRLSDGYAHLMRQAGVSPGDVVPVLLPRGAELVVVILGLLKAGAAYALLDERWTPARLRAVVAELGAKLLVHRADSGPDLALPGWSPPEGPAEAPAGFAPVAVDGAHPCCVFVTSGTTGRPKAVLSPHRATVRLFRPGSFARFDARTVMPLAAPLPWDGFTLELWSVLLNGGTSVVVRDPYLTPEALRRGVREHGVDTVFLNSGLLALFVDEDPDAFTGVVQVITGGDRASVPHVRELLRRHPGLTIVNGYGPVEGTVVATAHRVGPADCDLPDGIPIGRPVPDTRVHVLDGDRPCAVGEPGELCIAGDGLAIGYLGARELTEERFPVLGLEGGRTRVYRTGDLVRWSGDGVLHYLGRMDRQVKIRGHRVEPAEVERQVERLPEVRRCAVVPLRDSSGGCRGLAAFCVPAADGDPLPDARERLRRDLVHYQVPDVVVSVAELPLTVRGKVDESALLALLPDRAAERGTPPPAAGAEPDGADAEPADPLAALVARTCAAVLGRDRVSADARFDDLGGSSLDAGRVCARLTTELRRPVPVAELLRHQSARALAARLRATPWTPPPAREDRTAAGVPLTPVQANFLARHLHDADDRPARCRTVWVLDGPVDLGALRR
ncbi:non-ribosomal peptide synthetase, partial [Marinitenerispora sediminis]